MLVRSTKRVAKMRAFKMEQGPTGSAAPFQMAEMWWKHASVERVTDVLNNPIRQPDRIQTQCPRSQKSGGRLLAEAR